VDYRAVNDRATKDCYPLPIIEDCLDTLQGTTCFSTLDMASDSCIKHLGKMLLLMFLKTKWCSSHLLLHRCGILRIDFMLYRD
jgi:hypothetical protein